MQHIFQRNLVRYLRSLKKKTGADYLYYSGGSALNIKANTLIFEKIGFNDVFIPPCCNDSGLAIGAGAYLAVQKGENIEIVRPYNNNWGIDPDYFYSHDTVEKVAELLVQKKVIGICNGNGESGPRALGNRSIVSLASSKKLSIRVSMHIKKREWYRPLAPIMLEKNAICFIGEKNIHHLSRFMLMDFRILPEKRMEIEGAIHVDGTARIQVVYKPDNHFMFELLSLLDRKYDVPALINTSFNQSGEPIVHTRSEAFETALKMGLDALVYNGRLTQF
jgi:carbamoyltransferase